MRRSSAVAVLLHEESFLMVDNWVDHIELRLNRYGTFVVRGNKHGENPDSGRRSWGRWRLTPDLKDPSSVHSALDGMAESLGVELDWQRAVPIIASIDWLTAAVIASKAGLVVSDLPAADDLLKQRALRPLGQVTVGVVWGYEMHELQMPFERWVRILGGESWAVDHPYWYEGERFVGTWSFDDRHGLEVTYGDGGVGWEGVLKNMDLISGPRVDGIDLASLTLTAAPAVRQSDASKP